jgi:hypothetical protein
MRDQINTNRANVLTQSAAFGRQGFATHTIDQSFQNQLATLPGSVLGTVSDQLELFGQAPQYGAMYGWGTGANAPRTRGYLESVRQAQMINPGAPVGQLAQMFGEQGEAPRQRQAQVMSGGAFGLVKSGGGQKTLQEWAESILRWFEGLRGGSDRGKAFSYGQLMAQYFPGSNIDAWFDANAVTPDMKSYWWSYALAKTQNGNADTQSEFDITPQTESLAQNRLRATTATTIGQFQLGGTMGGAYNNREQANRWFGEMMSSFINRVIPSATSKGPLASMQYMPDTIESILMTMMENSGKFGEVLGGIVGYGGATGGAGEWLKGAANWGLDAIDPLGLVPGNTGRFGIDLPDVGNLWDAITPGDYDVGDYGTMGGTTTAGMHPDMQRKVGAMMRDNPRLKINSGLRDNAMQQRLKKRGVGRVSGRPSAHTSGMAADMGPRDQYGWISKNAHRYGLKSGKNKGEPWHVGMGDMASPWVGDYDVGDMPDIISAIKDLFTGSDPISGISGIATPIFELLGGLMADGDADLSKLAYKGDVYFQLYEKSKQVTYGKGLVARVLESFADVMSGGGGGNLASGTSTAGAGGGGARGAAYNMFESAPPNIMQAMSSGDEMTRGKAVAQAMYQAGFRGQDLKNMTAIAYRESHWTSNESSSWVEDSDDVGGGLLGINQLPFINAGKTPPYTKGDILDPYINARIAYDMFTRSPEAKGRIGGGPSGYTPWDFPGAQNWQYKVPFDKGAAAVQAAGLGDIDPGARYDYMMPLPTQQQKGQVVEFHNTFQVGTGVSNSGSGIDLRRTASTIADHLENEMKQRLQRVS